MEDFIIVFENLKAIFSFLVSIWWLYTPVLLFLFLIVTFQNYTRTKFLAAQEWVLLEIKGSRDVKQSPKAMDNVFTALHGIHDPPKWRDRFFKGKVQIWYSLEIVARQGSIHFYIRTLKSFKNLVESHLYAQYPNCEISPVYNDHISALPPDLKGGGYDLFGTEFILTKEDAYPIRTYPLFEELNPGREPEDIRRIDPLASITEIFSSLNPLEYMGIQILAKPTGDDWVKKGQEVVDKLLGKTPKAKEDFLVGVVKFIDGLLPGASPAEAPKEEKEKKKDQTPGQYEALKAVENALSKFGYESGVRFIYLAPKDKFQRSHIAAIGGAFKQFSTYNLNGFKMNKAASTKAKQPFKEMKEFNKKTAMLGKFKTREFVEKPFIFTTEELASVFHFPDFSVKTPLIPRIEAKKGEPPVELPIS